MPLVERPEQRPEPQVTAQQLMHAECLLCHTALPSNMQPAMVWCLATQLSWPMTWSLAALLQAALDLFEAQWEELIGMPSWQSAAEDPEVRRRPCCRTVPSYLSE